MGRFRPQLAVGLVVGSCLLVPGCGGEDGTTTAAEPDGERAAVTTFVERFMARRRAGLPARTFLSAAAGRAYEEHRGGLWLYDETLPGGPGAIYAGYTLWPTRRKDAWEIEVKIDARWLGDSPRSEIVELLTVGPGRSATGTDAELVVLGVRREEAGQGLPTVVAQTRERIYRAAVRHDYGALAALVDPARFRYAPNETGNPTRYWRRLEEVAHVPIVGDVLPAVLHTRYARKGDTYVWPSAYAKEPSEWTRQDLGALERLHSKAEIRRFRQLGGYTGRRVGIRSDGTWLFFVSR